MALFTDQAADQDTVRSAGQSAGQISRAKFFRHYWRKKPFLFRKAALDSLDELVSCVTEDELLRLASVEIVESRMVSSDYKLTLGPFNQATVPDGSLLMIQGLEQHLGEINQLLLNEFTFLPRWRIEDVMATLGHTGANCGAHFDRYDVFLVQVKGSKHWQMDSGGHREHHLDPESDIRILNRFAPVTTEIADPGDVLYIPPGSGHLGTAAGQSITLSIGIRNPTMPELISDLADMLIDGTEIAEIDGTEIDSTNTDRTLVGSRNVNSTLDDDLQSPEGGISSADLVNLQSKLADIMLNSELIAHWYGKYMTQPREPELLPAEKSLTRSQVSDLISGPMRIACTLPTRLTYIESSEIESNENENNENESNEIAKEKRLTVFVNGAALSAPPKVLRWLQPLCHNRQINSDQISNGDQDLDLLQSLFNNGAIEIVNLETAEEK